MLTRIVLRKIFHRLVRESIAKKIVKVADNIIRVAVAEGIFDESAKGANYLKNNFPKLYKKLYDENLEALFFIVRKPLQRYLDLIKVYQTNKTEYEKELCKLYGK